MTFGPMQLVVIALPDARASSAVIDHLRVERDDGALRIVDSLLTSKNDDGDLLVVQATALSIEDCGCGGSLAAALFGHPIDHSLRSRFTTERRIHASENGDFSLSTDDLAEIADRIPRGAAALVMLIEHRWCLGFQEALQAHDGALLAQGWITPGTLLELSNEAVDGPGRWGNA